ncbi:MAG: hypothetical protein K2H96_05885 [Muribaculaceae bacterium]|nr:hypothetical protein [Muribaculaceae bacterium]
MKRLYNPILLIAFLSGMLFPAINVYAEETIKAIPKMVKTPTRGEISTISVNPPEGRVKELSTIKISFVGITSLVLDESSDEAPYLEDSTGTIIYPEVTTQANTLICSFNPALTKETTYMLVVPEGYCLLDGERFYRQLTYNYTISSQGSDDIITSAPDGEKVTCQSDFLSYFVLEGGMSGMPIAGKPLHYVLSGDELYMYNIMTINPYGGVQTESYIRGTKVDEATYRFTFPQAVYENAKEGIVETWYLNHLITGINPDTQTETYAINTEENYADFRIEENGDLVWVNCPDENDSSTAIGMTDGKGAWTGFANIRSSYLSFDDNAPVPPAEAEQEEWTLTYGPSDNREKRDVKVVFSENDVWIQGLSKIYLPDAWVHGVMNGNYIEFDAYMGECEMIGQYLFAYTFTTKPSEKKEQLKFRYYKNEDAMTSNHNILINPNEWFYYAVEYYERPELTKGTTGIQDFTADHSAILTTKYYDLSGNEVSENATGIFIRIDLTINGETIRTKVIK